MGTLRDGFLMFMLREYVYEKNVFLVVKKIKKIFDCDITPACVRGWFKLFSSEGRMLENTDKSRLFRIQSKKLKEWFYPNNACLLSMCKELISFRKDLELLCKIEKTLYDEIWVSYTDNCYKFERRYEVGVENTKNKQFFEVWWETTGRASFMFPSVENITIEKFCFAIQNIRVCSYFLRKSIQMKHIFLIDSRNPLFSAICTNLNEDYNILALPPNLSDIAPMNHPFDKLYDQFREFLKENRCSNLEVIPAAFKQFSKENLNLFESVFDDFYTCCVLYTKLH